MTTPTILSVVADIAQVIIGGVSLVLAVWAIRVSRTVGELQATTQQASIRPYITVVKAGLIAYKPRAPIRLMVQFQNLGQTASVMTKMSAEVHAVSIKDKAPNHKVSVRPEAAAMLVAPGDHMRIEIDEAHATHLSSQDWDQILDGTKRLRLTAVAEYQDVFGQSHRTSSVAFMSPAKAWADGALHFEGNATQVT